MKKLNVAILTLLLVFQTVLSPISVLAVDAPVNNSETGETASTNTSEQTPTEPSTGELETQAPVADEVVSKPVDIVQQDLAASLDPSVIDEDAAADQMGTLNAPEGTAFVPSSMQSDIEMTFAGLKLYNNSNSLIKDATDLGNFTGNSPKKGDTVYLYYEFKVDPTKDYGIGSTFTFQLPEYMIEEFSPGSFTQKRTIDQTGGWAAYTATYNSGSKRVTFTLDSDLESTSPGEVKFEYQAKFGNFQDESKLDQELVIPVEGKTPVEIEFTFDPKGSGDLLTKQAGNISRAADGTVTIPWTLWVNTGGKKLSSAQLADVTDGKHALDGVITVERYAVGLNGFDQDNPGTPVQTTPNAFPLTLDDGYYAYKVTYTTKVTEAPTKTNMTYTNTATLTGTGITTTPKTGSKPVTYGPSLLKTKGGDKYSSKWTIKYNWLGQQIDATKANLTDTMTKTTGSGTHKIDYTSLKVYQVTLSADGQSASNQTLLTAGTHYDLTNKTDQGFNLDFAKSKNNDNKVTAAYLIEYDANLIDEFVTDANDGTVTNTVTRADTSESKSDSINLTPAIFSKSGGQLGTVDYIDKIITWTVTINAERDLKNFAITDNFTTTNNDGKTLEHALTQWGKEDPDYFKVTGANGLVYSIKDLSNGNPNAGNKGFKVNFTSDIPKGTKITIQYKTKFDFEPNGGVAKSYDNTAKATWDGAKSTDNEASRDSSYTPDPESPTTKNGYKKWSVDNSAQEFSWLIGMNINKQDIDGATLTDTLGAGHYIDVPTGKTLKDQIMISKLNLTTEEGEKYSPNQLLGEANWDVTPTLDPSGKVIGFVITFKGLTGDNAQNKQPYLVEYKSKDIDDIYGQDSGNKNQYTNGAELDTPNNGLYNYSATATISNEANELISKTAAVNTAADTIKWTVKVNTSNSKLGSITLTDKPSTNQKLLTGTFTKQKVQLKVDGTLENVGNPEVIAASEIMLTGKDTSNNPITVSSTDPVPAGVTLDGGFSLDLGELNGEGYIIEYHTFFMGDPNVGEKVSNSASIGYAGAESAGTTDDDVEEANFKYSSSDTNASPKKGSLQLKKFKVNPLTGVREKFQGVKFELWNRNGTIKLDEGTTDADGTVTFKNLRYGIYTVKETTPAGYKPMADLSVTLKDAVNIADGGKAYVVENIEDVDLSSACSTFELTIKDIDGAAVANTAIQLKDSNGDVKYTGATDGTGKVNDIKRPGTGGKEVQAGEYTVVDTGTNKELGQIIVKYGDGCKGSIEPTPSCSVFTIILNGADTKPRPNVAVILKGSNNVNISATTGTDGKFTVPSATPAGDYSLYEGNQFLGKVTISYKTNCEATVTEAPTCETFTITLKDVDGEIRKGVNVTIKVKVPGSPGTGTTIESGTTNNDGKFITTKPLVPGEYEVYENGDKIGEFAVNTECTATIQPAPLCPIFTITVKDQDDVVRPNVKVTVKVKGGNTIIVQDVVTDNDGKITLPTTTTPGEYTVYEGDLFLGDITVSYKNNPCGDEVKAAPKCEIFVLTLQNSSGNPRENVELTVKDAKGDLVEVNGNTTFTTDILGSITLPNVITAGTYTVYEGTKPLKTFTVKDECQVIVKPSSGGGGWTPPPVDPDPKPPVEPEKPDPEKPDPGKPDPEKPDPGKPDPEKPDPGKPDPEKPDPEKPDPGKPDPEKPDPEKPDPGKPNPEPPVDPGKPNPEKPDPGKPVDPGKPNPEKPGKPTVDDVIEDGKKLPPYNSSRPDKDTLDKYKDFQNKYNKLSEDEKLLVRQKVNVDKIFAAIEEMEALLAKGKLPQTDGANQSGLTLAGLLLVAGSLFFLRRRNAEVK